LKIELEIEFLGDLGLSKVIHNQRDYYQSKTGAFPIKWSAPVKK
jgi:hypothetical protein